MEFYPISVGMYNQPTAEGRETNVDGGLAGRRRSGPLWVHVDGKKR